MQSKSILLDQTFYEKIQLMNQYIMSVRGGLKHLSRGSPFGITWLVE